MAQGKQTPRQKMINLMYLVFIAMMALNIDAEIILMGQRLWDELGLKGVRLEINSLGQAPERAEHRAESRCHQGAG